MAQKVMQLFSVAVLAGSAALNPAIAQTNSADPVWSSKPTRVDKTRQSLERLPAKPAPHLAESTPERYPLELKRTLALRVIDSVTFVHDGRKYRLVDLDPVPPAKTCTRKSGQRWACGLKSRVALAGLLRGKQIRCAESGEKEGFALVECVRGSKDVGELLTAKGFAVAAEGKDRYREAEAAAERDRAGIWSE